MLEVDLIISFATGAGFAAFAHRSLQNEKLWDVNRFFMFNLIFQGLIFSPMVLYLFWAYPGWASMFFFTSLDQIHPAFLPALAFSVIFFGMAGFYISYTHVKAGDFLAAHGLWIRALTIVFAVFGFGYRRALFPGGEWKAETQEYPIADFFGTELSYTLLGMGIVFFPSLFGPQLKWFWKAGGTFEDQVKIWNHGFGIWFSSVVIGAVGYITFIYGYREEAERTYFIDEAAFPGLSYFAPLAGFLVSQIACLTLFSFVLLVPRPPTRSR